MRSGYRREGNGDSGANAGAAGDLEGAADLFHALVHAEDSEVPVSAKLVGAGSEPQPSSRIFDVAAAQAVVVAVRRGIVVI